MSLPSFKQKMVGSSYVDQARRRLQVTRVIFTLGFLVIGAKLITIGFMQGAQESYIGEQESTTGLQTGRADIVDRNGSILATSITTSSMYANPRVILNAKEAAKKLASILPKLQQKEILQRLTAKKSFVWLARHLTPTQKAKVIGLGIPGIDFMRDQRRVYPYANLTAHVTGFADVDGNGIAGLEKGLDERLRSEDAPLEISLDIRFQHVLYDELTNGIKEFSAKGGSGIVMDVNTGEILAMVSFPDFDPNNPNHKDKDSLFNRATLGVYEMGSTMKVANTALALESGHINLATQFDATQPLKVGRFQVSDYRGKNSWLNVAQIFVHSSNIGSAKMALKVGGKRQKAFLNKLGLLKPAKIELPEIGTPISPANWSDTSTITIAYGYGVSTSPLQLTRAIAGIVNNGLMPQPTLLSKQQGTIVQTRIVSPSTSIKVRHLMQQVVSKGTARKAKVTGITIAAKTGTTNYRHAHGRGYQKKDVTTYCVGAFPETPRYIVFVMLDCPKGLKKTFGFNAGGWNAAPISGRIIKRISTLAGIESNIETESNDEAFLLAEYR